MEKIFQRHYHVNTKYQIRTLADSFLTCHINDEFVSEKRLKECINAYIYLENDTFVTPSIIEQSTHLGEEWELVPSDEDKIKSSYYNIFQALNDELNLANPRTFVKFSVLIRELWPKYYENILDKEPNEEYQLHSAFLVLLSHIWYPTNCDAQVFNNSFNKENTPKFIIRVREHLELIIPKYKKQNTNNSYSINRLDSIVRDATSYLNQFPDYIRFMREKNGET